MLNAASGLLHLLRDLGAEVDVLDGRLRVTAPGSVLTDEIKRQIAEIKPRLVELITGAFDLLRRRGIRLIQDEGRFMIGLWEDADGREVREALEIIGDGDAAVVHLDDPAADIPTRYRQFVPEYVKEIWAKQGLLASPGERLAAAAQARYVNYLFDTLGTAPSRSRISTATVLQGMLVKKKRGKYNHNASKTQIAAGGHLMWPPRNTLLTSESTRWSNARPTISFQDPRIQPTYGELQSSIFENFKDELDVRPWRLHESLGLVGKALIRPW